MADIRVITLDCLLHRLEDVLGHNSLLYHRSSRACARRTRAA
jgi:hypothetical protein